MTTAEIIACAISVTAAIVSITALILTRRQPPAIQRARREPVQWETDGCVVTFDRRLTEREMEQFRTEWKRRHGGIAREVLSHDEEATGA